MPALPPVSKVLKIVVPFALTSGANALSRFYQSYSGTAPTSPQAQTYADSVATAAATHMGSLMSGLYTFLGPTVEDLTSSTGAVGHSGIANAGSRAGGALPNSTCAIVEFVIARRYRGGKPKAFCPFGVSADVGGNGAWVPAFPTAVTAGWVAFINAINAAGWTGAGTLAPVNVSYYQGFHSVQNPITLRWRNVPTLRGTPVVDFVQGYGTETGLGSQRRRNNV